MKKYLTILLVLLGGVGAQAQATADTLSLATSIDLIYGTLLVPAAEKPVPLALIIAGSGPTDRDGNNPMMSNNSLKMLAERLAVEGIASLRYDKRGVAASASPKVQEADLRFEHFVDDAVGWLELLAADSRFDSLYVLGHSEGSLIGILAAQRVAVAGLVSLAGPGQNALEVLKLQMQSQLPFIRDTALVLLDRFAQGDTITTVPPYLQSLFRPSVQPYLRSLFKYDPAEEIKTLRCPVAIVQGTTDLQVQVSDAERLHQAVPSAELVVIEGMNHVLKAAPAERMANLTTYGQADLPLHEVFVVWLSKFFRDLRRE
ncbi:MAG: alpha/beta fold hydrolase [Bacteroidota bacterium]